MEPPRTGITGTSKAPPRRLESIEDVVVDAAVITLYVRLRALRIRRPFGAAGAAPTLNPPSCGAPKPLAPAPKPPAGGPNDTGAGAPNAGAGADAPNAFAL